MSAKTDVRLSAAFDTSRAISREAVEACHGVIACLAIKDGLPPNGSEVRAVMQRVREAVTEHNATILR